MNSPAYVKGKDVKKAIEYFEHALFTLVTLEVESTHPEMMMVTKNLEVAEQILLNPTYLSSSFMQINYQLDSISAIPILNQFNQQRQQSLLQKNKPSNETKKKPDVP